MDRCGGDGQERTMQLDDGFVLPASFEKSCVSRHRLAFQLLLGRSALYRGHGGVSPQGDGIGATAGAATGSILSRFAARRVQTVGVGVTG